MLGLAAAAATISTVEQKGSQPYSYQYVILRKEPLKMELFMLCVHFFLLI